MDIFLALPVRAKTKPHRRLIALLLAAHFAFVGSAFGQALVDEPAEDPTIFPFFSSDQTQEGYYTEDFYDITDNGVYDSAGNLVVLPSEPPADETLLSDETANDQAVVDSSFHSSADTPKTAFEAYKESIIENWGSKRAFTVKRLEGIRQNLHDETQRFDQLDETIDRLEEEFAPIREQAETLKDQIDLLNRQLSASKNKINNAELQVAEKQIALKELMGEIQKSQVALDSQRNAALDYINMVYQEEEKFLDFYDEGSSTLKLLLADNSVSENLLGRDYSSVLESTGRKVFYDLRARQMELADKQKRLQSEKAELDRFYEALNHERRILNEGKASKKDLLEQTIGEEERYQKLLEESIQQQLESAIAIQNMKDNIEFIERKIDLLDESMDNIDNLASDPENADELLQLINPSEENGDVDGVLDSEIEAAIQDDVKVSPYPFSWPVPPIAVTAYFHDPSYPKKWGQHQAVDLRAKQYTEIRAPANAYVFQTKDNGMGYSYIILAHKNKLITVYGHVSEIIAKAGTVVKKGDVIGLSGGTPGTKGAGWQTTGPHLHFEVWKQGEPVNPLDYLPVLELPIEYIPDEYLARTKD